MGKIGEYKTKIAQVEGKISKLNQMKFEGKEKEAAAQIYKDLYKELELLHAKLQVVEELEQEIENGYRFEPNPVKTIHIPEYTHTKSSKQEAFEKMIAREEARAANGEETMQEMILRFLKDSEVALDVVDMAQLSGWKYDPSSFGIHIKTLMGENVHKPMDPKIHRLPIKMENGRGNNTYHYVLIGKKYTKF